MRMGIQISEFNKKLLISSLGIIILTYGICLLYKKQTVKEGLAPFFTPLDAILAAQAAASQILPSSLLKMLGIETKAAANTNAIITDGEINTNTLLSQAQANVEKLIAQAKADNMKLLRVIDQLKRFLNKQISQGFNAAKNHADDVKRDLEQKIEEVKGYVKKKSNRQFLWGALKSAKDAAITANSYIQMLALMSKAYDWAIPFLQCGWYWFINLRHCFLWYLLDTIGQILYLPFKYLIWLKPSIFEPPADLFWDTLDNLDCLVYDMIGYHFLHYSPTIIKQCFMCNPVDFPKNLASAIKEFPIGIKDMSNFFSERALDNLENNKIVAKAILGMDNDE